jgi:hypothetical protein
LDGLFDNMRRLDERGPASRGIVVDAEGAMLGPDCVLVRRTGTGYRCIEPEEAAPLQSFLFGAEGDDPDRLFHLIGGITRALNAGELALAEIYGLRIPVSGLDDRQLKQLAAAAPFVKANFNPDQPRIPAGEPGAGEWTTEGGGSGGNTAQTEDASGAAAADASPGTSIPTAAGAAFAAEESSPILGILGRPALQSLAHCWSEGTGCRGKPSGRKIGRRVASARWLIRSRSQDCRVAGMLNSTVSGSMAAGRKTTQCWKPRGPAMPIR